MILRSVGTGYCFSRVRRPSVRSLDGILPFPVGLRLTTLTQQQPYMIVNKAQFYLTDFPVVATEQQPYSKVIKIIVICTVMSSHK